MSNKTVKSKGLKSNFVYNLITQLISYVSPLIVSPYISRILLPAGVGQYSYANSIVTYFVLFSAFGFINYGNKKTSQERENKNDYSNTFWSIFFARAILFFVSMLVFLLLVYFQVFGSEINSVVFLCMSLFIAATLFDASFLFQGLENFRIIAGINSVCKIISIAFVFLLVKSPDDLYIYCLINGGYTAITSLIGWAIALRYLKTPQKDQIHIFQTLKQSLVFFIPGLAISIYTIVDKTMIGVIAGSTQNGYYEQANKIYTIASSIIYAIYPVILARIAYLNEKGDEEGIKEKYIQLGKAHGLITLPCVAGLYAISQYFFPCFFGDSFVSSVPIMYVLAPLIFVSSISGALLNAYFIPKNKINQATIIYFIGAAVNFSLNFIFIKRWGALGAAITSLISEAMISGIMIFITRNNVPYKKIIVNDLKPLIASGLMFVFVFLLNAYALEAAKLSNIWITIIDVAVGVFSYGILLVILRDKTALMVLKTVAHKLTKGKTDSPTL